MVGVGDTYIRVDTIEEKRKNQVRVPVAGAARHDAVEDSGVELRQSKTLRSASGTSSIVHLLRRSSVVHTGEFFCRPREHGD